MLHNFNCDGLQEKVELKKQIEEEFNEAEAGFLSLNSLKPKFMKAPDDDSSSDESSSEDASSDDDSSESESEDYSSDSESSSIPQEECEIEEEEFYEYPSD